MVGAGAVIDGAGDAVACEFGKTPVMTAAPSRLTSMTEMAAPAIKG